MIRTGKPGASTVGTRGTPVPSQLRTPGAGNTQLAHEESSPQVATTAGGHSVRKERAGVRLRRGPAWF